MDLDRFSLEISIIFIWRFLTGICQQCYVEINIFVARLTKLEILYTAKIALSFLSGWFVEKFPMEAIIFVIFITRSLQ